MALDLRIARDYIKALDLRGNPRGLLSMDAATTADEVFDQAKAQAQVVGATLFSFAQGVDIGVRESISDSALLAQLVANKSASAETDPFKWFNAYARVLQNVGWTLQDSGWNDYTTRGQAAEVNEKIIEVITVALSPAPAALSIVSAAVAALKSMNPNSPWITIFSRESQKARMARFQVGLVENNTAGDVFVSLLSVLIEAEHNITQVLFFKFREAHASFRATNAKVSINRQALADLGPTIRSKVRAWQADYVSTILDLKL